MSAIATLITAEQLSQMPGLGRCELLRGELVMQDWLEGGCAEVWVVEPKTRTISVYRGRRESFVLTASDTLDGGELLPGLRIRVADVFG